MAQNSDNAPDERKGEQDEILKELDRIDERLLGQLNDPRLANGIPPDQRRDDLAFIQMSGMTSSKEEETPKILPPLGDKFDVDTTKPLSFFEKGVRDVDAEMAPGGTLDKENTEKPLAPATSQATSMPPLRDIIADLSEKSRAAGTPDKDVPTDSEPQNLYESQADSIQREPILPPPDLKAAERLLQEMEGEAPLPPAISEADEIAAESGADAENFDESDNTPDTDKKEPGPSRRRGKRRARARNQMGVLIARVTIACIILGMLGFVGYEGYELYKTRWAGPETLYDQAGLLATNGDYMGASEAYLQFAARQPNSPLRPEAQFGAAFALQESRPESKDETSRVYERALTLFEQFLKDNPTHPKAARAQILMGILSFELGKYQQAIEMLQDPDLRIKDPVAAVPMLRTLARSYAKLGDEESARSYYLQSAGMTGNHTPDVDFEELGMLYHSLAERATKPEAKAKYVQQALQHWSSAAQIPGIDPASKANLRNKVEVLKGKSPEEITSAPPVEAGENAAQEVPSQEGTPETAPAEGENVEPTEGEAMTPGVEGEPAVATDEMSEPQPASEPAGEPVANDAAEAAPEHAPENAPENAPEQPAPAQPAAEQPTQEQAASVAPESAPPQNEAEASSTHIVKAGDTLSKLATAYHTTVENLRAWNGLRDDVIKLGDRLHVKRPADDAEAGFLPLPEAPVVADPAEVQSPQPEAKGEPH
ncbi:MAG: LysM peptidoglycan-binding domain-containing protein [Candidatus Hydrogenedentes bacterium]|nr:LysM peptidoglycan-binding domain-containing protein [Candidatus Hydrogenedentota bacterium]